MSTILLVAHHHQTASILRLALKHLGLAHRLVHVPNLPAARRYLEPNCPRCKRHPSPDLILLGAKLPFVEYCEVLSWLRAQPSLKKIPVCLLDDLSLDSKAGLELVLETRILELSK